jgi:HAMP domain-containing protein
MAASHGSGSEMKLRAKFNLAIFAAFIVGFIGAGVFLQHLFVEDAREQVLQNARIMMSAANAIRNYTAHEILPVVGREVEGRFLAISVPSYAAQTNFHDVQSGFPDYVYKEAALNPTNPLDRVTEWEADFVNTFRREPGLKEMVGEHDTPSGPSLTLARPITIHDANCLACHSTPDRASAAMTKVYGTANGFGWQLDETVAAQFVSLPLALPLAKARTTFLTFMGILLGVFLAIVLILNALLHYVIIRPVVRVAAVANEVSLGNLDVKDYERPGNDEISSLATSFNRMRRSLESALKLLDPPA